MTKAVSLKLLAVVADLPEVSARQFTAFITLGTRLVGFTSFLSLVGPSSPSRRLYFSWGEK